MPATSSTANILHIIVPLLPAISPRFFTTAGAAGQGPACGIFRASYAIRKSYSL
jgi:hypothetical protein